MKYQISDFIRVEKLGEGTYGVVYKAVEKSTGNYYALKKIKENDSEGIASTTLREIMILKALIHPNIVLMVDVIVSNLKIYMLFEYVDVDLRVYLNKLESQLDQKIGKSFAYQILQGLLFIHLRRFFHRDLKPANILVDTNTLTIKLADFGLGRMYTVPMKKFTDNVVTLWYRAPELLLGTEIYSCAIDIWSVACIIPEIMTNRPIFMADTEIYQLFTIFQILGTPTTDELERMKQMKHFSENFPKWPCKLDKVLNCDTNTLYYDLLKKMFNYNSNERLNARDCLLHPYFDDVDKESLPTSNLEKTSCTFGTLKFYNHLSAQMK